MPIYGARPEAWDAWIALGVSEDLLPSVANPNAELAPNSKLQGIGKTPSRYNQDGKVVGIAKWPLYSPGDREIMAWRNQRDYALSVQTRGEIGAFDTDVHDREKSDAIRSVFLDILGTVPVRYRSNSGKFLIPFRKVGFELTKRVIPVDGGMIEVLGTGQQFIADGYHSSGVHYEWSGELADMPELTEEQFTRLWDALVAVFATADVKIAREKKDGTGHGTSAGADEVSAWLVDNWETHGDGSAGQLFIECPFASSHTSDSGPTATAYYPAGTGGYSQGHFVCLHAHCVGREDRDYLNATGYSASEFADLPSAGSGGAGGGGQGGGGDDGDGQIDDRSGMGAERSPAKVPASDTPLALVRDKQGRIEPTADNLVKLCSRPDKIRWHLAYDTFKDELVCAPSGQAQGQEQWRAFTDVNYIDVRIELERRGMKPCGQELLRGAISKAAGERTIDTAVEWLSRLRWDGEERMASFCARAWGWTASDYSSAVGRYIWTAMAGRVLDPGCQADMAPILVGPQGAGKTSAIKAMVPDEDFYTSIPLDGHDDDTSRRLRGKLVGELEELRGLNSRHIEEIKAWITRTSEEWVPKYKEFASKFKRRLVFIGSTNDDEFLNDPTGERRWLPGRCRLLDVEWIKANRDQLWAEGAAMFMIDGVEWEPAQRLGLEEHHEFKVTDSWEPAVIRWLREPQLSNNLSPIDVGWTTTSEALAGAVNVPVAQHDKAKEMRMAKLLRSLGWNRKRITVGDERPWVYAPETK